MSNVGIKDANNATRLIDTFVRTEGADLVETQAVAMVNPSTGDPLLPTPEGAMPVIAEALPLPDGAATEATLAALNVIATAISNAVSALNAKATAINTGAIAGTVALDAPTLAALESITASTGGITDDQLRAAPVPMSATALPLPTGAATEAAQTTGNGTLASLLAKLIDSPATETTLASLDAKLPALDAGRLPVSLPPGGGGLTNTELRAAAVPVDVAGELLEAIEALRMGLQALTRTVGLLMPDTAGRMRVNVETGTTAVTGTLTGVTTVATVTNQAQVGALAANDQVPALLRVAAAGLRNNIQVS